MVKRPEQWKEFFAIIEWVPALGIGIGDDGEGGVVTSSRSE